MQFGDADSNVFATLKGLYVVRRGHNKPTALYIKCVSSMKVCIIIIQGIYSFTFFRFLPHRTAAIEENIIIRR